MPEHIDEVARLWSAPRTPRAAGHAMGSWLGAIEGSSLDTLLLFGTNLLPLLPDNLRWRRALANATVISASPFAPTETTVFSDLVLPVALPWLEERGCFVSHARQVVLTDPAPPPTDVPTSLDLTTRLASALLDDGSYREAFTPYLKYGPELAWEQCRALTAGRACDLTGATYAVLEEERSVRWPRTDEREDPTAAPVQMQLSKADRLTFPVKDSDGLALVVFADSHHTGARELTGFAPELHYAAPRAWVEVAGRDAVERKLRDGDFVAVESETGVMIARLWITDRVPRGVVAVPEHYGFLSDLEGGTDGRGEPESLPSLVTPLLTDPDSGQILTSCARVELRKPTEEEMGKRALRRT